MLLISMALPALVRSCPRLHPPVKAPLPAVHGLRALSTSAGSGSDECRGDDAIDRRGRNVSYIAFGSNLGDRARHIEEAVRQLGGIGEVLDTSFLYETKPMYNDAQPNYLNGIVKFSSKDKTPHELIHALKQIERSHGRDITRAHRNVARPIDLDIIMYDKISLDSPNLQVPHPRAFERRFVLQPLADIDASLEIPGQGPVSSLLQRLDDDDNNNIARVTPVHSSGNRRATKSEETSRLIEWGKRTLLMGIINVTPDSFSDGHKFTSMSAALRQVDDFCENDFDIVDVGGQSTRPGAEIVSEDEELGRVLPVVESIVNDYPDMLISVDTSTPAVAVAAVQSGAHIVNDVRAGGCAGMKKVMKKTEAIVSLMHMRGTPLNMQSLVTYENGVVTQAAKELRESVKKIRDKGVYRWNMIIDPGVGFAKTGEQSIEIIRQVNRFREECDDLPCLVGLSRKSWMKEAVGSKEMDARDWFTAGAVACMTGRSKAVDIVRVHNAMVAHAVRAGDLIGRG